MPHKNTKTLARNGNLVQANKLGLKLNVNGLEKSFIKKSIQKTEKTLKNQSEIAACE